jgi:hypothetical protein
MGTYNARRENEEFIYLSSLVFTGTGEKIAVELKSKGSATTFNHSEKIVGQLIRQLSVD